MRSIVILVLSLFLIIVVSLGIRFKQGKIAEYFKSRPKVYDAGSINISKTNPDYSINANLMLENSSITATYNTLEKVNGQTHNNYQVFPQNIVIQEGGRYFISNATQPNAIYELVFEKTKISKTPIAQEDYDGIFNAINNYIQTKINLVGPNMDVGPAPAPAIKEPTGIEKPHPVPKKVGPKPLKSKKDTLLAGTRVDKPDKNKLIDINYSNNAPSYIQLDNNRNMVSANREGVQYKTVCEPSSPNCPQAKNNMPMPVDSSLNQTLLPMVSKNASVPEPLIQPIGSSVSQLQPIGSSVSQLQPAGSSVSQLQPNNSWSINSDQPLTNKIKLQGINPKPAYRANPKSETKRLAKWNTWQNKLDNKLAQSQDPYHRAAQLQQCIQYQALKSLMSNV